MTCEEGYSCPGLLSCWVKEKGAYIYLGIFT